MAEADTCTTTLWDAALKAESGRGRPVRVRITEGGFGNGRTESRLTVYGLIRGQVALQQGLTADWNYVGQESARTIEVEYDKD